MAAMSERHSYPQNLLFLPPCAGSCLEKNVEPPVNSRIVPLKRVRGEIEIGWLTLVLELKHRLFLIAVCDGNESLLEVDVLGQCFCKW